MRYADILKCDCINGSGWGVSLYTQGCDKHCKGCFNPETWDFKAGKEFTEKTQQIILQLLNQPYMTRFSLLGGEPLAKQNRKELAHLLYNIRKEYPNIKIWIWTGYTWEQLMQELNQEDEKYNQDTDAQRLSAILFFVDVLVDGPFIQKQKDITLKWRGSCNQRVIDVPQSFSEDKIILYTK